MAYTRRLRYEHIAATAARNTLKRAGIINPTHNQTRAAERCALRHLLHTIPADDLVALRDELAANLQPTA